MYRESSSTLYIGQLAKIFKKPWFCYMVLFAGRFVAIFAEIRVFSSLGVCGPTNSSDGAVCCFRSCQTENGGTSEHMSCGPLCVARLW